MIEVEKKFILQPGDKERLIDGAIFVSKKEQTDTYYDTDSLVLTLEDKWLRKRNGNFELKSAIGRTPGARLATSNYEELETDAEIASALGLPIAEPLEQTLIKEGYNPFATIVTLREKYKKDGFTLDFDSTDFGFEVLEIELMVDTEAEGDTALEKIKQFATAHHLPFVRARGKLLEYIRQFRPEHYTKLFPQGDGFVN